MKGVAVKVTAQRIQYYDTDGKLVTESFQDYTRKTFSKQFASLDEFIKRWNATERKQTIIDELANAGIIWEALQEEISVGNTFVKVSVNLLGTKRTVYAIFMPVLMLRIL